MKITKNNYLLGFTFIVFFLFGIKLLFPQVCNVAMVENGRQKDSIEIEKEEQTKNIVINKINDSYSNNPKSTENNSVAPSEMNIYRRGEVAPLLGEAVFLMAKEKQKRIESIAFQIIKQHFLIVITYKWKLPGPLACSL